MNAEYINNIFNSQPFSMRYFILVLFMVVFASASVEAQSNAFKINLKDGTGQVIFLSDEPLLTIEGSELKINTRKAGYSYPLTMVKDYLFVYDASGVDNITLHTPGYTRTGDIIIVDTEGRRVDYSVTATSGLIMVSGKGTRFTIDISSYPTGVYLLTVDGLTTKIEKR